MALDFTKIPRHLLLLLLLFACLINLQAHTYWPPSPPQGSPIIIMPTPPHNQATDSSKCPCGTCDRTVSWSDLGVVCEGCGLWYHLACQNIPSSQYDELGDSNVHWNCTVCDFAHLSHTAFDLFGSVNSHTTSLSVSTTSISSSKFDPINKLLKI